MVRVDLEPTLSARPAKDVLVRRCREGYEFFKSLRQRKDDLETAKASAA